MQWNLFDLKNPRFIIESGFKSRAGYNGARTVCTALKTPDPVLVPALVPAFAPALAPALEPDLEHEAQAASNRETAESRPRRSCTINSYIADNYVLDTKTVSKASARTPLLQSSRRSRSETKNPSILPFMKPTGAFSKTRQSGSGQNETLPKLKMASASPLQRTGFEGPSGSQKLVSDFFPKK